MNQLRATLSAATAACLLIAFFTSRASAADAPPSIDVWPATAPPAPPPPLQAPQRAMSLVRSKPAKLGIDPKRIGMLGFSAGGTLTALACTNYDKRAYDPIDDIDQISCRPDFGVLLYPAW